MSMKLFGNLIEIDENGRLTIPTDGANAGLALGSDVLLYRSAANTLTTSDSVVVGGLSVSNLTSGRIPIIGADGLLTDDSDLTFSDDILTVTKIAGTTINGNLAFEGNRVISAENVDTRALQIHARDTGVGLVKVAEAQGAADPYFAMGGSQEFKFYNSGYGTIAGTLQLESNNKLQLRDDGIYVYSPSDGRSDFVSDGTIFLYAEDGTYVYDDDGDSQLIVRSNTDDAKILIDSNDDDLGTERSLIIFQDNRIDKWAIIKETNNNLSIYDAINANNVIVFDGTTIDIDDNMVTWNINPDGDGTRDLGTQNTAQWANVWSDLINGAEFTMMNKMRIMESELYEGYPTGFAIGFSDKWVDGVSIWHSENREQYMSGETPIFAVTEKWMEYKGYRYNPEHFVPRDEVESMIEAKVSQKLKELGLI